MAEINQENWTVKAVQALYATGAKEKDDFLSGREQARKTIHSSFQKLECDFNEGPPFPKLRLEHAGPATETEHALVLVLPDHEEHRCALRPDASNIRWVFSAEPGIVAAAQLHHWEVSDRRIRALVLAWMAACISDTFSMGDAAPPRESSGAVQTEVRGGFRPK